MREIFPVDILSQRIAHSIRFATWSRVAIFVIAATTSTAALADDLPTFRPGLWEFKRTAEPRGAGGKPMQVEDKKCTDPTSDMKTMNDTLAEQGCKFSAISRSGSAYTFSSDCEIRGTRYQSRSVLTVESDSAYRVEVSSSGAGSATKELLVAKRVGECRP